jgi:hypothetical protein
LAGRLQTGEKENWGSQEPRWRKGSPVCGGPSNSLLTADWSLLLVAHVGAAPPFPFQGSPRSRSDYMYGVGIFGGGALGSFGCNGFPGRADGEALRALRREASTEPWLSRRSWSTISILRDRTAPHRCPGAGAGLESRGVPE